MSYDPPQDAPPPAPPPPQPPQPGQTIKFPDKNGRMMRGVVCAPDDPNRSGTFKSARYGDIPVVLDTRNRAKRRADQAKTKGR